MPAHSMPLIDTHQLTGLWDLGQRVARKVDYFSRLPSFLEKELGSVLA